MTAILDRPTQAAVLGGMTAALFFDNPIGDEAADIAP
jgi:hypothetical protein